jgi:5'-methylthioadenosine phosphorylase
MAEPFCKNLRSLLISSAKELKLRYHAKGTVVTIEGPRFSTKAESFMFRKLGADVINMSTVPEVILAREVGICYQTIAMSTDYDCWKEGEESVTWEMILSIMKKNAENVKMLLLKTLSRINGTECECR